MIGFFIKKAFCDGWDHLFHIVLSNVCITALLLGSYFLVGVTLNAAAAAVPLSMLVLVICISLIMVLIFAINATAARIVAFKSVSLKEVLTEIPHVWKDGLLFGLIVGALVLLAFIGIPFYLGMGSFIGIFLAAVLFWILAVACLSLQWFMPIYAQLQNPFKKCLKKSFIIFFDNAGFSIFMFLYNTILLVMSAFLVFLVPGVTGILLSLNNAFRLRMYKYDWMEEHPDVSAKQARRQIPWDELIADDRETLGPRSFKSFIFPWKD